MKPSRIVAIVFWSLLFVSFVVEDVFFFNWTRASSYDWLSTIIFAFVLFGWFLADTRERGHTPSLLLKIAVVAIGMFAVPYYKFRYFGARAGFGFIGIVILALIGVVLAALLVEIAVHGAITI